MSDLTDKTLDELDKIAAKAGVPDPEGLATKDDVAAAIERGNPALVPEPEPGPGERTYLVIGPHVVYDTPPGQTFTATLAADHELSLIDAGHIQIQTKEE